KQFSKVESDGNHSSVGNVTEIVQGKAVESRRPNPNPAQAANDVAMQDHRRTEQRRSSDAHNNIETRRLVETTSNAAERANRALTEKGRGDKAIRKSGGEARGRPIDSVSRQTRGQHNKCDDPGGNPTVRESSHRGRARSSHGRSDHQPL